MAQASIFPIFTKIEYRDDGSAKAGFIRAVEDLTSSADRKLDTAGAGWRKSLDSAFSQPIGKGLLTRLEGGLGDVRGEISRFNLDARRMLDQAVAGPRTGGGALNLNAGAIRERAAADQARATAARELAAATEIAAREVGQLDAATQRAVVGLRQEALQHEAAARSTLEHAAAVDRVQAVLNRTAVATDAAVAATRRAGAANDNQRQGLQQLGFQVNDFVTQISSGTSVTQAFAQQAGQAAQAVQIMAGGTSRFAAFMGGPWGIALTAATIAIGPLVAKLFEGSTAADKARESLLGMTSQADRLAASLERVQSLRKTGLDLDVTNLEIERNRLTERQFQLEERLRRRGNGATARSIYRSEFQELEEIKQQLLGLNATIGLGRDEIRRQAKEAAAAAAKRAEAEAKAASRAGQRALALADRAMARTVGTADFASPLPGGRLTGRFNEDRGTRRHAGIDLAARTGTPVVAPQVGVVEAVGFSPTLGKFVVVSHGAGTTTRYGHLSAIDVTRG